MSMTVRYIRILTFAIISSLLCSCMQEETVNTDEVVESSTFRIGLRGGNPLLDDVVITLRIMAFDRVTGACRSNKYYNTSSGSTIVHSIKSGSYDFIFLANEPSSMNTTFDGITNRTALDGIAYPHTLFTSDLPIPMMQTVENVAVLTNNTGVSIAGGPAQSLWELALIRLAARIDIVLSSDEDLTAAFTGFRFDKIPDVVPLTSNYTGTVNRNITREFTLTANADYFETVSPLPAGTQWAHKVTRVILPASEFTPKTDVSKAVTFTVLLHNQYNPSCTMGVDEVSATKDYTLPRNHWLNAEGDVKTPLVMNIKASDWGIVGVPSDINDNRKLNVSHIKGIITPTNMMRIEFWSNQPTVELLANTKEGNVVNNVYQSLTGGSPTNFSYVYDPGTKTGQGTMTVLLNDNPSLGNGSSVQTITLDAGGLRREIALNTGVWGKGNTNKYVGTFHRASEVGERVISFNNTGTWTAAVSYPSGGVTDFVALSALRSSDPMIGTDTPGDPENYPVVVGDGTNGIDGQTVNGTGKVYFRVGMKSKLSGINPDFDTAPRYAKITITHTGGPTILYVRQGEAADYLMRPGDPNSSGAAVTDNRAYAKKFIPYNLTHPSLKAGGTNNYYQIPLRNTIPAADFYKYFTDYPSQVGAYFQWAGAAGNERLAFHPTNSITMPSSANSNFWNLIMSTHESCPPGYRRFRDAILGSADMGGLSGSEHRQSLLLNPFSGVGNSVSNVATGYLADGFFDRRALISILGSASNSVGPNNTQIAYRGTMINNPTTYASLFFSGAGARGYTYGNFPTSTGNGFYYSTGLSNAVQRYAWRMSMGGSEVSLDGMSRDYAASIRCIKE